MSFNRLRRAQGISYAYLEHTGKYTPHDLANNVAQPLQDGYVPRQHGRDRNGGIDVTSTDICSNKYCESSHRASGKL